MVGSGNPCVFVSFLIIRMEFSSLPQFRTSLSKRTTALSLDCRVWNEYGKKKYWNRKSTPGREKREASIQEPKFGG